MLGRDAGVLKKKKKLIESVRNVASCRGMDLCGRYFAEGGLL